MEILIRPIKKEEFEELAELTNNAYTIPYKPGKSVTLANDSVDKIKEEMMDGAEIFVAEAGNKLVGAIRVRLVGGDLLAYKLAVGGDFRNQGIGRKLVNHIFDYGKKIGVNKIKIEVSEAKGLILYYESFGFKVVNRYLNKSHFEVSMEKNIS